MVRVWYQGFEFRQVRVEGGSSLGWLDLRVVPVEGGSGCALFGVEGGSN